VSELEKFNLRRVVLDVVKPAGVSSIASLAEVIGGVTGVECVNITVEEVDSKTEGLLVTVEGQEIGFSALNEAIANCGSVVHSVDQVASGDRIIESVPVPLSRVRR
jgi:hypothetical protein